MAWNLATNTLTPNKEVLKKRWVLGVQVEFMVRV